MQVANNFDLCSDYFKEYRLKFYDYHSDLAFMGLVTIAKCSEYKASSNQDKTQKLKQVTSVLIESEGFLDDAISIATSRESGGSEHEEYTSKLRGYLDNEISAVCISMGQQALVEGLCTAAASLFEKTMSAENRIIASERNDIIR